MIMRPSHFTPPTLHEANRWRGLRVGLFGGSFNPPHEGHLHVARLAKRKLDLDFIWWLITPQNPLKDKSIIAPYDERHKAVEDMIAPHPYQIATHLEKEMATRYTYESVVTIQDSFPATDFVWICGMDNALIFHKWDRWNDLIQRIPIVFIARPPAHSLIKKAPIRNVNTIEQRQITKGFRLDLKTPSINWLMGTKMIDISSTQIRNNK